MQLYQTVKDSISQSPKELIASGMLTRTNGQFRLEGISAIAQYKLIITRVGYKTYAKPFSFIDRKAMGGGIAGQKPHYWVP